MYSNRKIRRNLSVIKKSEFGKRKCSPLVKRNGTKKAKVFWIKHEQAKVEVTENLKGDQFQPKIKKMGQEFANAQEESKATARYIFHGNHYLLRKPPIKLKSEQYMGT